MSQSFTFRPVNKNFDKQVDRVKDLAKDEADLINKGAEQVFIDKLTNACTGAAKTATGAAFFAGEAALVSTGAGVLADALLTLEAVAITKAVGVASKQLCEEAATVVVKGVEQSFSDLDNAISSIASRLVSPSDQANSDYSSMLSSAQNGDVQGAAYFASQLNNDFGLENLHQLSSGNYLLSQQSGSELLSSDFQPLRLLNNNSDGSSNVIKFGSLGGYEDIHYNGENAMGGISSIDVEKGNNTSSLITFDNAGNQHRTDYSGPNQTGNIIIGGVNGQNTAGTATFVYQGAELFGGNFAGSAIQAEIEIGNYDPNFSGVISSSNNGTSPFIYSATLTDGIYSDMAQSATSVTSNISSSIDLSNGKIEGWFLSTEGSQVAMQTQAQAISSGSQPNDFDFINFSNSTNLGTSSTTAVSQHPALGIWTKTG